LDTGPRRDIEVHQVFAPEDTDRKLVDSATPEVGEVDVRRIRDIPKLFVTAASEFFRHQESQKFHSVIIRMNVQMLEPIEDELLNSRVEMLLLIGSSHVGKLWVTITARLLVSNV
jgi:hypothetical protein